MWWRYPYNPTAYDDDYEGQPSQGGFYQWGLEFLLPVGLLSYGVLILYRQQAELGQDVTWTIQGNNAIAYGISILATAVFLHFHYFWGNLYDQIWFAVLGKIISLVVFIISTGYLCYRVGILGTG